LDIIWQYDDRGAGEFTRDFVQGRYMHTDDLNLFMNPASVVLIGASRDKQKLGYGVARNLVESGYDGEIFFVNPHGGELFGRQILTSIDELTNGIELALVVVSAGLVPETLSACSQKDIINFIVHTSGFKETGLEGSILEDTCLRIAREKGLRILGPNCIGVIDTHRPIDTTFLPPPMPNKGELAFITQSGALGAAMVDWARGEGIGFSRIVSLGNQLDIDESDMLRLAAEDPSTKSIMMYLESVQDGPKFIREAQSASELKPVIVLKVGNSDAGKAAAVSHTGALAGRGEAYDAVFRRARVLRASNTTELFGWAKVLAVSPRPVNNRVAILTNAGGPGVIAADAVEENGLRLAIFSSSTENALAQILPKSASIRNPVDMLASATPKTYAECLAVLLEDDNVDMVSVIAPPPPMYSATKIADDIIPIIKRSSKPVVVSFMGSKLVEDAIRKIRQSGIPEFSSPENGISALGALWKYESFRTQDPTALEFLLPTKMQTKVRSSLTRSVSNGNLANPRLVKEILEAYNLPVLPLAFAKSEQTAVNLALEIGYPVVMKIAVEGVSHKSDIGGILINLKTESDIRQGFNELKSRAQSAGLDEAFTGVYLQKMIDSGQEIIVGGVRDQIFGPMIMFGSGGVEVEGLRDFEFSLAPVTRASLEHLFNQTWAGKKLNGFRQQAMRDIPAVEDVLIKISQIMVDFPEINEIEINPLIVAEKGRGVYAVDSRMVVNSAKEKE